MKTFHISQWSTSAAHPNQTAVTATVLTTLPNGMASHATYSFMVDGRFDTPSDEFTAIVRAQLEAAQLL